MNFYINVFSGRDLVPPLQSIALLVRSSSGKEVPFTAQQREGTGGVFPFLSLVPLEKQYPTPNS